MKNVQCYELFGGIALKNHAFSFFPPKSYCCRSLKKSELDKIIYWEGQTFVFQVHQQRSNGSEYEIIVINNFFYT